MAAKKRGFDWGGLFAAIGVGATIAGGLATVASFLQSREPQLIIVECQCGREMGRATNATPIGTPYHCDTCNLDYEWADLSSINA
jgi:predicted RNA-binding Zn-ribbon protein involved in translation (DUF1610 family)